MRKVPYVGIPLRQVWSWTQRQVAALDADAGSHSVLFFLQLMTAAAWRICPTSQNHQGNSMTTRIPTETGLLLIIPKNYRTKFSKFVIDFWLQEDDRSTRARSLLFLSEFEAIFSCSVMDQARKVRIAAVFLLTSSYWLSFLGLLATTQHSQVNRLQLADDPLKQLVLSRHYFLLRKRLALPPGSEQSSLGLVGPRTHLENKEETKQALKRRMSNDCSTQATVLKLILLERHCFSAKRHSHQRQRRRFPHVRRSSVWRSNLPRLRQLPWKSSWFWRWRSIFAVVWPMPKGIERSWHFWFFSARITIVGSMPDVDQLEFVFQKAKITTLSSACPASALRHCVMG